MHILLIQSDVLDFDDGDEPQFVTEANTTVEEHNERIRERRVTLTRHSDDIKDFELLIYHTAQRVLHKGSQNVGIPLCTWLSRPHYSYI
jgi:hypothetical protein